MKYYIAYTNKGEISERVDWSADKETHNMKLDLALRSKSIKPKSVRWGKAA